MSRYPALLFISFTAFVCLMAAETAGGVEAADYIPANARLVNSRSIVIPAIPNEETGLLGGLKVEREILDQPVGEIPGLGAIEISSGFIHQMATSQPKL